MMSETTKPTLETQDSERSQSLADGAAAAADTTAPATTAETGGAASLGEAVSAAAEGAATVEELQREVAAARDRELRAYADLENFRKRIYRQMEEERKYATVPLMCDLLGIADNLARAIRAAEKTENGAGLLAGVQLVAQQFQRVLEQHHCRRIAAQGQPFDPRVHQAIGQQPSAQQPAGTVLEEAQVGYQLHERVIRPSMVLVSSGPATSDNPADATT
jgi:molecular chaperone GrpE